MLRLRGFYFGPPCPISLPELNYSTLLLSDSLPLITVSSPHLVFELQRICYRILNATRTHINNNGAVNDDKILILIMEQPKLVLLSFLLELIIITFITVQLINMEFTICFHETINITFYVLTQNPQV